jgi:3-hydroxybutyrate dehydrogenase
MSALPLQGKTALITGSTQGLGLATAKQFAAAGCRIIENGLRGGNYIGADLRDPAQIEAMMQAAGPIDILVNNAVVRHTRRTGTKASRSICLRPFTRSGSRCRR